MLDKILNELPRRACEHEEVVTTRNHGLQREVCESCGHVTVSLLDVGADDGQMVGTVHHPRPNISDRTTAVARAQHTG